MLLDKIRCYCISSLPSVHSQQVVQFLRMRGSCILVLMLACCSASSCPPNPRCDIVRCRQVTPMSCEKEGLQYVAKEEVCGCCDFCQRYIPRGEACGDKALKPRVGEAVKDCQPPSECMEGVCKEPVW